MNRKPVAGFTLIEMTLVMAIAAVLGSVALPRAQQGYKLRLVEKTAVEVHYIQSAAKNYHRDTGNWPASIADLQSTGYLPAGWTPNDPWGNAYAVSNNGTTFSVDAALPAEYTKALQSYLPNTTVDTTTNTVTSTTPLPGDEPSHDALLPRDGSRDMTGDLVINKDTPSVKLYDTVSGLSSWVRNVGGVFKVQNDSNTDLLTVDQAGNANLTGQLGLGATSATEGGQLLFRGAAGYPSYYLDSYTDQLRAIHKDPSTGTDTVRLTLTPQGHLALGNAAAASGEISLLDLRAGATRESMRIRTNGDANAYNDLIQGVLDTSGIASGKPLSYIWSLRKDGYFTQDTSGPTYELFAPLQGGGYRAPLLVKSNGDLILNGAAQNVVGNGNVGIGTTTPTDRLQVNGDVRLGVVSPAGTADVAGYGNFLSFSGGPSENGRDSENSDPLWMARYNVANDKTELRVSIGDNAQIDDKLVIGTASGGVWAPQITMTSDGRVGIRNNTPAVPLDVAGAMRSSSGYGFVPGGQNSVTLAGGGASPDAGNLLWGDNTGWKFHMGTNVGGTFTPRVTFMDTGNVGIGNTNPTAPLTIGARIPSNPQPPASDNVDQRILIQPESYDGPWRLVTREKGGIMQNNLEWMYGDAVTGIPLISMQVRDGQGWTGFGLKDPLSRHHFAGDVRIGPVAPAGTADAAGYGNRLYFSGGPAENGWDSDNSDQLAISRYNVSTNVTELRVQIGDDASVAQDSFVIGGADSGAGIPWRPGLVVYGDGQTKMMADSNPILFSKAYSSFPNDKTNAAEISNDTSGYKMLMLLGNKADGTGLRRVGLWDTLSIGHRQPPAGALDVQGQLVLRAHNGTTNPSHYFGLQVDQGGDSTVYYRHLGNVGTNDSSLRVHGQLAAHEKVQGKALVDLLFSRRDGVTVNGTVMGNVANSDLEAYDDPDGTMRVYLVTKVWAQVDLTLSKAGWASNISVGAPTTTVPAGTLLYRLSRDAKIYGDTAGNMVVRNGGYFLGSGANFSPDQGGSMELGAGNGTVSPGTPFIDFHFNNGLVQDYNVRLINDADGRLSLYGNLYVSGTVTSASDRRFKRDIRYLDPAKSLSQILRLQPARYHWRQEDFPDRRFPNGEDLGLIAQEVEAVLPQLVHTDQKGYKSLEYAKFAPVLISAVQALHQELQTYAAVRIIDDAARPDPKLLGSLLSVSKTRTPDKTVKGYLSARDVYLADAGRWASEAGNGYAYNQVFRADTDWVVPAGVNEIRIELWGGGGAQGGSATQFGEHQTAVATAGNPGGHLQKQLTVKPGQAFPVRLGTGSEPGLAIVWW